MRATPPLRLLAALLAVALVTACPRPAPAQELATALPATSRIQLSGFTRARAVVPLVAEATGKVLRVLADVGQPVGQGGVFALVDPTFIQLELRDNAVQQDRLRARIAYDDTEAARYRRLVDQGSAAQARLDELEQALSQSRHELAALEVGHDVLAERLARTRVTAPAGWLVMAREAEPGQWVTQGQTLGQAGDFGTLLVPFALAPEQLAALQGAGGALTLALPDLGREVPATVHRIYPGFDPETRKTAVDLAVTGLPGARGGLRAVLALEVPDPAGGVLLPRAAVSERYEQHWVRRDDGTEVQVVLLGNHGGPGGDLLRVASPEIAPGQRFALAGRE